MLAGAIRLGDHRDDVARAKAQTLYTARALRLAVDRELEGRLRALEALAASPYLEQGDLASFRMHAEHFLHTQPPGSAITVHDAMGRILVDTRQALPVSSADPPDRPISLHQVFRLGKPHISDLPTGVAPGLASIVIDVPGRHKGHVAYDVGMTVPLTVFQELLARQGIPSDWTVSILDRAGTHVARNRKPEQFVGKPATDTLRRLMASGKESTGAAVNLEGMAVLTAVSRSEISGWSVAIGVPWSLLLGPLWDSFLLALGGGACLALAGAMIAARLAQRIGGPVRALADMAWRIGRGLPIVSTPSGVAEVDEVAEALVASAADRQEAEARMRIVADALPMLVSYVGNDLMYRFVNRTYSDWLGLPMGAILGRTVADIHGEAVYAQIRPHIEEALAGRTSEFDLWMPIQGGERRYIWIRCQPHPGMDGAVNGFFITGTDLTARRRIEDALKASEEALRASNERLRLAQSAGRVGIWDFDLIRQKIWCSDSLFHLAGREPEPRELEPQEVVALIHPDDRNRFEQEAQEAISGAPPCDTEFRIIRADSALRWFVARGEVIRDGRGRPTRFMGVALDITDRRMAEERQTLLMREVDHRAKNALAVVQSLLRLTPPDEPARFVNSVEGRVRALARVHGLLAANRWDGAGIRLLLEDELSPYLEPGTSRASLQGPDLTVTADAAQPLSMVFHELVTNAAKHGALSSPEGRLDVSWHLNRSDGSLEIEWKESGGPVIEGPPARRGFGSTLLEASTRQFDGAVYLDWQAEGLICRLRLPANQVARTGRAEPYRTGTDKPVQHRLLSGTRVLAVEDNALVALALTESLEALGCEVVTAASLEAALSLARTAAIDMAILDVDLGGEPAFPVAEILLERHLPFLFATGFGEVDPDGRWAGHPLIHKPYSREELERALNQIRAHA